MLPKAELALEISPALLGVGYIMGYRPGAVCVSGALVSSLTLTPLIALAGRGAQRAALPGDAEARRRHGRRRDLVALRALRRRRRGRHRRDPDRAAQPADDGGRVPRRGARHAGRRCRRAARSGERTDRDLPAWFVFGGVAVVVLAAALVPGVFAGGMAPLQRAVLAAGVGVFGVLFVAVAARIVGIVGVSSQPTSGIALVTLLGTATVFAVAGWVDTGARAAVLTVGTIVAIAASKAGDIAQDLKTGWLVGATPARQQLGQLIGAACACWAVAATVLLLGSAYQFGSRDIPAPQATLMKTIIEGVLAGELPWGLVLTGVGLSIGAILCGVSGAGVRDRRLPAARDDVAALRRRLVRALAERGRSPVAAGGVDTGVLAASGLVAGEGLAGVLVAGLVATGVVGKAGAPRLPAELGELAALAIASLILVFLHRGGRAR